MKTENKKLGLKKSTIVNLNKEQLNNIRGGGKEGTLPFLPSAMCGISYASRCCAR